MYVSIIHHSSLLHISIKSLSLKSAILPQRYSNIVVIFRYTYHYPYFDIRPAITVMSSATASREISTLGSSLRAVPWTQVSWALFFKNHGGTESTAMVNLGGLNHHWTAMENLIQQQSGSFKRKDEDSRCSNSVLTNSSWDIPYKSGTISQTKRGM